MTPATKHIHEAADYVRNSGFTVTVDSSFSWVSMNGPGEEGPFLQDQEADDFIAEARALCNRYPSLDMDTAALALAKPYIESIE